MSPPAPSDYGAASRRTPSRPLVIAPAHEESLAHRQCAVALGRGGELIALPPRPDRHAKHEPNTAARWTLGRWLRACVRDGAHRGRQDYDRRSGYNLKNNDYQNSARPGVNDDTSATTPIKF